MADVLISCAEPDREIAQACAADLANAGYSAEVHSDGPGGGRPPAEPMSADELTAARCILVIWSAAAIASRQVQDIAELGAATGRLVATRVAGLDPRLVPVGFRNFHAGPANDMARIRQAVAAIGVIPSEPAASASTVPSAPPKRPIDDHILEMQAWT